MGCLTCWPKLAIPFSFGWREDAAGAGDGQPLVARQRPVETSGTLPLGPALPLQSPLRTLSSRSLCWRVTWQHSSRTGST